jgi:hypothetical protein
MESIVNIKHTGQAIEGAHAVLYKGFSEHQGSTTAGKYNVFSISIPSIYFAYIRMLD